MPRYSHDDPRYAEALREMSRRLNDLMNDRNWSRADLTRAAAKHMPEGGRFGPDNTSNFVNGKRRPTRPFLQALCAAFGVKEEDILPDFLLDRPGSPTSQPPPLAQVPGKHNLYRVYIDRELALPDALKIIEVLGIINGGGTGGSNGHDPKVQWTGRYAS